MFILARAGLAEHIALPGAGQVSDHSHFTPQEFFAAKHIGQYKKNPYTFGRIPAPYGILQPKKQTSISNKQTNAWQDPGPDKSR